MIMMIITIWTTDREGCNLKQQKYSTIERKVQNKIKKELTPKVHVWKFVANVAVPALTSNVDSTLVILILPRSNDNRGQAARNKSNNDKLMINPF